MVCRQAVSCVGPKWALVVEEGAFKLNFRVAHHASPTRDAHE